MSKRIAVKQSQAMNQDRQVILQYMNQTLASKQYDEKLEQIKQKGHKRFFH
jgi:hypothetical protein